MSSNKKSNQIGALGTILPKDGADSAQSVEQLESQVAEGLFNDYFDLMTQNGLSFLQLGQLFTKETAPKEAQALIDADIAKIDLENAETIFAIGSHAYPDFSKLLARIASATLYRRYDDADGGADGGQHQETVAGVFDRLKMDDLFRAVVEDEETTEETPKVSAWKRLLSWGEADPKKAKEELSLADRARQLSNALPAVCAEVQRQKVSVRRQYANIQELYRPVADLTIEQSKVLAKLQIGYAAAEYVHRTQQPTDSSIGGKRFTSEMRRQEASRNYDLLGGRVDDLAGQATMMMLTVSQSVTTYRSIQNLHVQYEDLVENGIPTWDALLESTVLFSRVMDQIAQSEKVSDAQKQALKKVKPTSVRGQKLQP